VVLLLFIVLALLVPSPWHLVVLGCGIVLEVGEIVWGRRLARRWRPHTGSEAAIGREAEVVEACRPTGLVRFDGELWKATCAAGADVGETVTILAVRRLTLEVEPVGRTTRAGDEAAAR
jgi:membrane protein implicated in regulation of membrane protease activity